MLWKRVTLHPPTLAPLFSRNADRPTRCPGFSPQANSLVHAIPSGCVTKHHTWPFLHVLPSAGTQKSCTQVQGNTSPSCKGLPQHPRCTQTPQTQARLPKWLSSSPAWASQCPFCSLLPPQGVDHHTFTKLQATHHHANKAISQMHPNQPRHR